MNFSRFSIASFLVLFFVPSLAFSKPFFREGVPAALSDVSSKSESKLKNFNDSRVALDAPRPKFSDLVKVLSKSVVNISSEGSDEDEAKEDGKQNPFFRKGPKDNYRSLGSGFVISEDGYIATNFHVVENAQKIVVRFDEERDEYEAELVGSDPRTDLALLKIVSDHKLEPMYIGNSDNVEVGEWVLAIGNQFQLGQSVTAGIVSAKSRKVPTRLSGPYDQFIQTDAAINPGSSGGPLVNTKGQVVGINTAIFSPGRQQYGGTGFNIGIGFAIPIKMAKDVLKQLKEDGRVTRGLLGVIIQHISTDIANALELKSEDGALVADVVKGSPAGKAGFKRRDIILEYDGNKVRDHDDLPLLVAKTPVGSRVSVLVRRDKKEILLYPRIDELTDLSFKVKRDKPKPDLLGLVVRTVSKDISESIGQDEPSGVVIKSVKQGSAADEAGLQAGDVIEEVGSKRIEDNKRYDQVLRTLSKKSVVLLLVRRKAGTRFLTLKLQ